MVEKAGVETHLAASFLTGVSNILMTVESKIYVFEASFVAGFVSVSVTGAFFSGSAGFSTGLVSALTGSGPLAELRLVNSLVPWAKRHFSPYLQEPFSLQFLHISYLRRRTTGWDDYDEVLSESVPATDFYPWDSLTLFSVEEREPLPERD